MQIKPRTTVLCIDRGKLNLKQKRALKRARQEAQASGTTNWRGLCWLCCCLQAELLSGHATHETSEQVRIF